MRREGHIGKDRRTGRWYAVVDIHAPGELRKQRWSRGHRTRTDALRELNRITAEINAGRFTDAAGLTVAEWLDHWLTVKSTRLKESTLEKYRRDVEVHIVPALGGIKLNQLRVEHLDAFYGDLLHYGQRRPVGPRARTSEVTERAIRLRGEGLTWQQTADRLAVEFPDTCAGITRHVVAGLVRRHRADDSAARRQPLAPASIRHIHRTLKQALGYAVKARRIPANPADYAEVPGVPRYRHTVWAPADASAFLAGTRGERDHALWVFLLLGMTRRGEALGLRWDDVDLDAGTAAIRRTLGLVKGQVKVTTPKTDAGRRDIALAPPVVDALRAWRATQAADRLMLGEGWRDAGWVFTTPDGGHMHPKTVSSRFRRLVTGLGLPPIRLHDLRHTGATLALEAGTDVVVVADQLGHSTTAVTRDLYQHVNAGMRSEAVGRVAALLDTAPSLALAAQRPDAKVLEGELRSNLGCRALMGTASPTERGMVLRDASTAPEPGAGVKGRGVFEQDGSAPSVFQGYWLDPVRLASILGDPEPGHPPDRYAATATAPPPVPAGIWE